MVIHHVFANRSNAGDWLSATGIQLLLSQQITEHLCDEPFVPATLAALRRLPAGDVIVEHLCDAPFIRQTLRRLARVAPDDLVVVGGGGLVMDYFQPFWEGLAALGDQVRYCLWGLGAVDLKREESRPDRGLMAEIAARALLCSVRDEHTRALLGGPALPPPVACPSVLAVRRTRRDGWGLLHVDNLTTVGEEEYEVMGRAAGTFAQRTGRPYRESNNLHRADDRRDLARVLNLYLASDIVVTSRLHGCILAAALGRKVVAVSGDWKIESFMTAAGLDGWVLAQEEVDRLPDLLSGIGDQPDPGAFLARTRRRHRDIGHRVRALAALGTTKEAVT